MSGVEQSGWPVWHEGGTPAKGLTVEDRRFPREMTGLHYVDCTFERCVFHGYLKSSEFSGCEFVDCRFEYSAIVSTKLKYCRFRRCTFSGAAIYHCDLYRADFRAGNTFPDAELGLVSLGRSDLGGTSELRRSSFAPFCGEDQEGAPRIVHPDDGRTPTEFDEVRRLRPLVRRPLIQEDPRAYEALLRSTRLNAPLDDILGGRLAEAAEMYRVLSAGWMATGAYDDAAWAYRRSRRLTRANLAPGRRSAVPDRDLPLVRGKKGLRRLGLWAALAVADPLCGFGTRLRGIVLSLLAMVVGFAVLLRTFSAVELTGNGEAGGWFDALHYSVGQLATTPPADLTLSGAGWSFAADVETLIGIALLGLFGFVLANRLRYS